jgi:hypothetical protein
MSKYVTVTTVQSGGNLATYIKRRCLGSLLIAGAVGSLMLFPLSAIAQGTSPKITEFSLASTGWPSAGYYYYSEYHNKPCFHSDSSHMITFMMAYENDAVNDTRFGNYSTTIRIFGCEDTPMLLPGILSAPFVDEPNSSFSVDIGYILSGCGITLTQAGTLSYQRLGSQIIITGPYNYTDNTFCSGSGRTGTIMVKLSLSLSTPGTTDDSFQHPIEPSFQCVADSCDP